MDVYTLAASCYFAVTGYLPTTGLDRKLYGKNLISPIKHRSDLTPALNQVIMNGMELEAINRPSLAVWTEQLRQAVAPPPVTATVRVMRPEPQGNWLENLLGLNKPTPQNTPIQHIPIQPNPFPHKSAKGIDYSELEKLLKAQEWRKADELTAKLMLKATNREKEGWLDAEYIKNFPCEDLRTIDQLWVHYSNSKFGFSIQKKIWLECGGEIGKYDFKVWDKFGAKVGWYNPPKFFIIGGGWKTYIKFMNDTKNARNCLSGSLPSSLDWMNINYLFSWSNLWKSEENWTVVGNIRQILVGASVGLFIDLFSRRDL
jgi:serine/threonine-protein kinase